MKYSELLASGELDGYEAGDVGDNRFSLITSEDIDGPIAEHATCDACGHQGCLYRPFRRSDSYRAFAVCPVCDEAMEF